jgi:hypothetical protein
LVAYSPCEFTVGRRRKRALRPLVMFICFIVIERDCFYVVDCVTVSLLPMQIYPFTTNNYHTHPNNMISVASSSFFGGSRSSN